MLTIKINRKEKIIQIGAKNCWNCGTKDGHPRTWLEIFEIYNYLNDLKPFSELMYMSQFS